MKKRYFLAIFLFVILVALINNFVIIPYKRFETPQKALDSYDKRATLLYSVCADNVAVLVFEHTENSFEIKLCAQDKRGWTSLEKKFKKEKSAIFEGGFWELRDVFGKKVLQISMLVDNERIPSLTDSKNTQIEWKTHPTVNGKLYLNGIGIVSDENFDINNYEVYID